MNNNEYKESTRLVDEKSKESENEKLWNNFQIDFHREAQDFPSNKIYGTINIKPNSARALIKNFILYINGSPRGELTGNYDKLCVSGFDTKKEREISVSIEAIPHNDKWAKIKRQISETRKFTFTGQILGLSPVVSFDWTENVSEPDVIVKWDHIGDRCAHKYVLCLDNKEIQYINQRSICDELEVCIHSLKPNEEHTVQVIAKLNNGRETYRSDLIDFTVPEKKDGENNEVVISVSNEEVPYSLKAHIEKVEDEKRDDTPPEDDKHRKRALELHQRLEDEIKKRRGF